MSLAAVAKLEPYEIVAPLAAAWVKCIARDTRLDRTVAIRILPRHLSFKIELKDCFGRSVHVPGVSPRLVVRPAETTAKWNHREEEAYFCFARGDETRHVA